jgi:hypothetical protein
MRRGLLLLLTAALLAGAGCAATAEPSPRQREAEQEARIKKDAKEKALNNRVIREAELELGPGASPDQIGELAALKKAKAEERASEAEASPEEKAKAADVKAKEAKALREAEAAEDEKLGGTATTGEAPPSGTRFCGTIPESAAHLALTNVTTRRLSCDQAREYALTIFHCSTHACTVGGYDFRCANLGREETVDMRCTAGDVVLRFQTGV